MRLVEVVVVSLLTSASKVHGTHDLGDGCGAALSLCGGSGFDGATCCEVDLECLTPTDVTMPGGYGDSDVGSYGAYGFYGADEYTGPYSICAPPSTGAGEGVAGIDLRTLTLADALDSLASGDYTSEELTSAFLAQIARYEDVYNAFTFLAPEALEQARASDARRAAGGLIGSLEGIPTGIKEALNIAGYPATLGWNYTYSGAGGIDYFPLEDAALVARLRGAGAVIIGKTNIPAFSFDGERTLTSWDGATINAVNPFLVPGASSAGTATATAAGASSLSVFIHGFAVWGVAEETGTSIQNPSSAQSLVGVRTTYGLIPRDGLAPLAGSTRDVLGPITKTVRDGALALNAMAAFGTSDFTGQAPEGGYAALLGVTTLEGARIGLWGPSWRRDTELSPAIAQLYEDALPAFEALGATLVEDPFAGSGFKELAGAIQPDQRGRESVAHDFYLYLKTLGVDSVEEFVDQVGASPFNAGQPLEGLCDGLPQPERTICTNGVENPSAPQDLEPFYAARAAYRETFNRVFEEQRLDALVYPQSLDLWAPNLSDVPGNETQSPEVNILGTPGVFVPSTKLFDDSGVPVPFSLAFLGPVYQEAKLLALAYDYEQATQLRHVPQLSRNQSEVLAILKGGR